MPAYTGPEFTDGSGTPLSAANLNDIVSALEKASIATKVTALPGTPFDGQEVFFEVDATNGVYWHLRYRSASTSTYKWEFLGGPPLFSEVATSETTTSTSYTDLATVGPSVTLPLAGDYEVSFSAALNMATSGSGWVTPKFGSAAASDIDSAIDSFNGGTMTVGRPSIVRTGLAASAVVKLQYRSGSGNTLTVVRRNLSVRPIRVG